MPDAHEDRVRRVVLALERRAPGAPAVADEVGAVAAPARLRGELLQHALLAEPVDVEARLPDADRRHVQQHAEVRGQPARVLVQHAVPVHHDHLRQQLRPVLLHLPVQLYQVRRLPECEEPGHVLHVQLHHLVLLVNDLPTPEKEVSNRAAEPSDSSESRSSSH